MIPWANADHAITFAIRRSGIAKLDPGDRAIVEFFVVSIQAVRFADTAPKSDGATLLVKGAGLGMGFAPKSGGLAEISVAVVMGLIEKNSYEGIASDGFVGG